MSLWTGWLPGTLKSYGESEILDQQTSLIHAVHARCVLERTVLIKEDIEDDDGRGEGE